MKASQFNFFRTTPVYLVETDAISNYLQTKEMIREGLPKVFPSTLDENYWVDE
jgi:hypothetical protein